MQTELFSQLYDQYLDKIYRFIYFRVNSEELAQDLTSRVFLSLWQKINSPTKTLFSNISNHQAFLYRCARNAIVDFYRGKKKNPLSLDSLPENFSDSHLLHEKNSQEKMEISGDISAIMEGLKGIKKQYAEVIIFYYLNDLSIQEISQILSKREGSIRVLIHRAIMALKAKMQIGES